MKDQLRVIFSENFLKLKTIQDTTESALKTLHDGMQEFSVKSEEADLNAGQKLAELRKHTAEFAQKISVVLESAKEDLVGAGTALRDEVQEYATKLREDVHV